MRQHLQVDLGTLVSSEPDVADLAFPSGAIERLDDAAPGKVHVRIGVVDALVHLPEIQIVRAEPLEGLVQLTHRHRRVAAVRADLRHEEDPLAAILDGAAEAILALAIVVSQALSMNVMPASIAACTMLDGFADRRNEPPR